MKLSHFDHPFFPLSILKVWSLSIIREELKIGNRVAHFLYDRTIEKWLNFRLSNTRNFHPKYHKLS